MIGKQRTQQMKKTALGKWLEFDKHRALGIEREKRKNEEKQEHEVSTSRKDDLGENIASQGRKHLL